MSAPIPLRQDFDATMLLHLGKELEGWPSSRRLLEYGMIAAHRRS
jgi:hypothetical protein